MLVPVLQAQAQTSTTPTTPATACSSSLWVGGKTYAAGSVVVYSDGNRYIAKIANAGYNPTISTHYWSRYICSTPVVSPVPPPAPPSAPVLGAGCSSTPWTGGKAYPAGQVVSHANGSTYIAKYANPGYNPTVSTYYWAPYTCAASAPALPACNSSNWVGGKAYSAGQVVSYNGGSKYIARYANAGFNPTVSTFYWARHTCTEAAPLVSPGTWAVVGSSTAAGCCPLVSDWVRLVRQTYASRAVDIVNFAKGGTSSYVGLPAESLPVPYRPLPDPLHNIDAALARTPKLVLLSYPSNDIDSGFSVDEVVRNLLATRSKALAGGAAVIMLSTQPMNFPPEKLRQLEQIDERLQAAAPQCFVALRKAMAAPDGTLAKIYDSGDRRHPNDAGHALIRDKIVSLIDGGQCVRVPPA